MSKKKTYKTKLKSHYVVVDSVELEMKKILETVDRLDNEGYSPDEILKIISPEEMFINNIDY